MPKPTVRPSTLSRRHGAHAAMCFAFALAMLASPPTPAADGSAARFYEDALRRYEQSDVDGTIIQLKNALQADRKMLAVHVLLGKALMAKGDVAAAEAAFDEALNLGVNRSEVVIPLARSVVAQGKQKELVEQPRFQSAGLPSSVQAQLLLIKSAAYSDLGDPKAALKAIDDARATDPGSIDVWLAEVPVRIRTRQFKEALAAIDRARSLNPNSAELHYQLGSILHVQGELQAALKAYDMALAALDTHVDARVARAGLYIDTRREDLAAKDVAVLVEKSPTDPRGWYLQALLAERDGKPQLVRTSLAEITELLDPVPIEYVRYRPQLLLLNGQAHFGLGQREKAKPLFEAFQRVQPGSPVAKLLANIYLAEGNQDRAVDMLEQYLRAYPGDSQAMALLASAHMAKGRHSRAASLMQEALRNRDAPELYSAYGLSLLGSGQTANALPQLELAYKKDPGQTQAAFALVGLYLRGNQVPKALTVANALVARSPNNPSCHHLLGLVKAQNRDAAGARASFEQALKLDPAMLPATLSLARLEIATGNFDRAQTLLDGTLKADERNTEAMYEQAALAERRGKPADALRWLQKAFDIAGIKDLRAALALVDLHMRQGRPTDALKVAQVLVASLPDDLRVLIAMSRAQLLNGDPAGARATLTSATRIAAYESQIQVEIALLQMSARNLPGAAYSLEKALSSQPDHLPAQVLMTEVETRQGEFAKAEQRAQLIIKRQPKLAIGHSLMGDLELARKQPGRAVEAYRRAHQVQPSTDTFARLFGVLATQDPKAALALADPWLKTHPDDIVAQRLVAQAHVRSNNMPAARLAFERLRQMAPNDASVLNDLANVMLRLKDPQAAAVAEQALALDPNNALLIDTAGWAALQAGKIDRALQLLRDARLRRPDSSEIRYHLAVALAQSGRKAEARDELRSALSNKSGFDGRPQAEALLLTLN